MLVYQNGGTGYIARSSIPTGTDLIDKWKVFMAGLLQGTGNRDTYPHRILSTPFIGEPGTHVFGDLPRALARSTPKTEAESVLSYLSLSADSLP